MCVVLIPTKGIPETSYVWIVDPTGWVVAVVLRTPLVRVNCPVPTTYETISSPINASPLSTLMLPKEAKGLVLATETTVSSDVNAEVVLTSSVSGLTPFISIKLPIPWWAWLNCVTSNIEPVNNSPLSWESPSTVVAGDTSALVLLFAP